mmetsp:Transcript_24239/g.60998  ORF Transcript_24239/g.60998 Transcript_24239/m.60998 type:complete len:213 (-) Transcript_24239:1474-2112(-)
MVYGQLHDDRRLTRNSKQVVKPLQYIMIRNSTPAASASNSWRLPPPTCSLPAAAPPRGGSGAGPGTSCHTEAGRRAAATARVLVRARAPVGRAHVGKCRSPPGQAGFFSLQLCRLVIRAASLRSRVLRRRGTVGAASPVLFANAASRLVSPSASSLAASRRRACAAASILPRGAPARARRLCSWLMPGTCCGRFLARSCRCACRGAHPPPRR